MGWWGYMLLSLTWPVVRSQSVVVGPLDSWQKVSSHWHSCLEALVYICNFYFFSATFAKMFWHVLTMFFGEAWSGFVFEPFTINAKIITNQLKISFFFSFSDRYLKLSIWYAPNWSPAKTAMELPHFHRPWTQNCRRDTSAFPDHVFRPKMIDHLDLAVLFEIIIFMDI